MAAGFDAKDLFQLVAAESVGKLGLAFHNLPPGHAEVKSVGAGSWGEQHEVFPGDLLVEAQGKDLKSVSKEEFKDMISQQRPLTLIFYASVPEPEAAGASEAPQPRRSLRSQSSRQAEPLPQKPASQPVSVSQPPVEEPPTQPTPSGQPSKPTEPSQPPQPTPPSQPAQPPAPSEPSETAQPTPPSQPSQPTSQPAQPTTPSQPNQPITSQPAQPTTPSQQNQPITSQPAQPTPPSEPSQPITSQPVQPTASQPSQPIESQLTQPTTPSQPSQPTQSSQPPSIESEPEKDPAGQPTPQTEEEPQMREASQDAGVEPREDLKPETPQEPPPKLGAPVQLEVKPAEEAPEQPQVEVATAHQIEQRSTTQPPVEPERRSSRQSSHEAKIEVVAQSTRPSEAQAPVAPAEPMPEMQKTEVPQQTVRHEENDEAGRVARASVASKRTSRKASGQAAEQLEVISVQPSEQLGQAPLEAQLRAARAEVLELQEQLKKVESTSGRRSREADAAAASYARLKSELSTESAERAALREQKKKLQNEVSSLTSEAQEVPTLRHELREAERKREPVSPAKNRESQRAREDILRSELEELEVTLKKVKADLRRSQEMVRDRDAELWSSAVPGSALQLRMEETVARGLQRQLLEEAAQLKERSQAQQESALQSVQTELRVERAAMRSVQRSAESQDEATRAAVQRQVQQQLLSQSDAKDSLQRAENAAVRGLKRRQDEVKRMTFQLHDPLVEEANAIRQGASEEEAMALHLSTRLRSLEEHMAELHGDGSGSARVVEKAEMFDTARQSEAQALQEEVKALQRLDEMKKELEESDLYSLNVELHKERGLHQKAVKSGAEWAAEARTSQVSNVKEVTEVALLRQKLLNESGAFGRLQSILAAEEMAAAKANQSLDQLRKEISRGEADHLKNQLSLQMGKSTSQAQQVVALQEKLEEEAREMERLRHQELLRRHQFTLEAAEATAHRAACQLAEDRLDTVPACNMSEQLQLAHEQLQQQLRGLQQDLTALKQERLAEASADAPAPRASDASGPRPAPLESPMEGPAAPVAPDATTVTALTVMEPLRPVVAAVEPSPHFGADKDVLASRQDEDQLRVLRTEVQVLRSSEAALKSQIAEKISELQEQRETNRELLQSSQLLGQAALEGENQADYFNFEFQKMRRALEEDKERARGAHEQVRLLRREIEAQKEEMDQMAISSGTSPHPAHKAKRVVQTRAMPPRSHTTPARAGPGRSRPPRSPPATTRSSGSAVEAADAPEDDAGYDEILNLSSGIEATEVPSQALPEAFAQLKDEILELQRRNQVLEAVAQRDAMNSTLQAPGSEAGRSRLGLLDGDNPEAMAVYEKRLRKERREAAAAAMRAVAAKQNLEETLAEKRTEALSQELQDATEELEALQAQAALAIKGVASNEVGQVTAIKDEAMSEAAALSSTLIDSKERMKTLEEQVAGLQKEAAEVPKIRSLLDAAEKRLLQDNQAQVELSKIRATLHQESQAALTYAAQDAKDAEDMLRSALAAETTCLIMAQSEVQRADEKMLRLEDAGKRELEAALQCAQEELEEAKRSMGSEAEGARLLQEAEEALVAMADEKVQAVETRAELQQEKAARAAELRAANWFYAAEAAAWAEGESAEATAVVASRQEEARSLQQQESSLNAASAEAAAFKAEAASLRKEALGLRGELGKEEAAFQQMRLAAERARAAESATLRSALTEVRAEAAKGASAFHRAEDAERELRRLRLDRSDKEKQVQDLTRQLLDAERRASTAVDASQAALPESLHQIQRHLGILSAASASAATGGLQGPMGPMGPMQEPPDATPLATLRPAQGQGPIDGPMHGVRAGPMPGTQPQQDLGDRATQLRARAEGLRGEVQQWQRRRQGDDR